MGALPLTDCVVNSPNEVEIFDEERDGRGWSSDVVAWCLTPDAATRALELGWQRVEELPPPVTPDDLIEEMTEGRTVVQ
jgi:hypothetical protein